MKIEGEPQTNPAKGLSAFLPKFTEKQLKEKYHVQMSSISLFGNNWSAIKEGRCPLCERKMQRVNHNGASICRSKHHIKPFIITKQKMKEVLSQL